MFDIDLKVKNIEEVEFFLSDIPKGVQKALQRSTSRTLSAVKGHMVRGARETYTVKAKMLREDLEIKRPSFTNLRGQIKSTGRPILLQHFAHKKNTKRRHFRVAVKKGNYKTIRNSFVTDFGTVLARKGAARYPLEAKYSLSAPQMLEGDMSKLDRFARTTLERRLDHEVINLLERGK